MPAGKGKKSKSSKSKRRSAADMAVAGFTRSTGAYGRYTPGGPELKWRDSTSGASQLVYGLATGSQYLNIVDLGTGPNQRIGRTIIIKEIEIKINMMAQWYLAAATQPELTNVSYRVDLILDKQANGAAPNGADIYDTLIATTAPENRFPNLLNSDRFVFMKRWEGDINPPSFQIAQAASISQLAVGRDLKLSKKCNIKVELNPTTPTTIADVRSNNLFLMYSLSLGQPNSLGISVLSTADTRIRFHDA